MADFNNILKKLNDEKNKSEFYSSLSQYEYSKLYLLNEIDNKLGEIDLTLKSTNTI